MLDVKRATAIIKNAIPDGDIQAVVPYKGLYLFQVFTKRSFEEEMDPFYSVNQETGEFKDFSIITDGNPKEINNLFVEAKKSKS